MIYAQATHHPEDAASVRAEQRLSGDRQTRAGRTATGRPAGKVENSLAAGTRPGAGAGTERGSASRAAETPALPAALAAVYRVEGVLGAGAMGVVYRAVQIALDRPVALKLPTLADADAVARFVREGRLLSRLEHPNLVRVYDAGEEEGRPYIALEFVRGCTLTALAAGRALPLPIAASLVAQLLDGLRDAHAHQVLHRDVKGDNALVTSDGVVKLADFGLARSEAERGATQVGTIMGTPAYMAPEQAMGETVDARADLYSAGIVFFELATGRLPFEADSVGALLSMQIRQPPPPISVLLPGAPAGLAEVMGRALAKKREDRYVTAGNFAEALRAVVGERAIERAPEAIGKLVARANNGGAGDAVAGATYLGPPASAANRTRARSSRALPRARALATNAPLAAPETTNRALSRVSPRAAGVVALLVSAGVIAAFGFGLFTKAPVGIDPKAPSNLLPVAERPRDVQAADDGVAPPTASTGTVTGTPAAAGLPNVVRVTTGPKSMHVWLSEPAPAGTAVRYGLLGTRSKTSRDFPSGKTDHLLDALVPAARYEGELTFGKQSRSFLFDTRALASSEGAAVLRTGARGIDELRLVQRETWLGAAWRVQLGADRHDSALEFVESFDGGQTWGKPQTLDRKLENVSLSAGEAGLALGWLRGHGLASEDGQGKGVAVLRFRKWGAPDWEPEQSAPWCCNDPAALLLLPADRRGWHLFAPVGSREVVGRTLVGPGISLRLPTTPLFALGAGVSHLEGVSDLKVAATGSGWLMAARLHSKGHDLQWSSTIGVAPDRWGTVESLTSRRGSGGGSFDLLSIGARQFVAFDSEGAVWCVSRADGEARFSESWGRPPVSMGARQDRPAFFSFNGRPYLAFMTQEASIYGRRWSIDTLHNPTPAGWETLPRRAALFPDLQLEDPKDLRIAPCGDRLVTLVSGSGKASVVCYRLPLPGR